MFADRAKRQRQRVVPISLIPVGSARLAERLRTVTAGPTPVVAPGNGVRERLRQQRCQRIGWRKVSGKQIGQGLVQAADHIARVGLQRGHGTVASGVGERRGERLSPVEKGQSDRDGVAGSRAGHERSSLRGRCATPLVNESCRGHSSSNHTVLPHQLP